MTSKPHPPRSVFATFRVAGDDLLPERITAILKIAPTLAVRKGDKHKPSSDSREIVARTGIWYLSSKPLVRSESVVDHLEFLLRNVLHQGDPKTHQALQRALDQLNAQAVMSAFWHGSAGSKAPSIPATLRFQIAQIPAELETDFDADSREDLRHRVRA